jgi:hypothetical protein
LQFDLQFPVKAIWEVFGAALVKLFVASLRETAKSATANRNTIMAPLNLVRLTTGRAVRQYPLPTTIRLRQLHQSSLLCLPRKDSQDKDSINTEATEYSKSTTDDDAARNEEAAFDPKSTSPSEEKAKTGEGNEVVRPR